MKAPSMWFTQIFIELFIQTLEHSKNQILKFGQNLEVLDIFNDFSSKNLDTRFLDTQKIWMEK